MPAHIRIINLCYRLYIRLKDRLRIIRKYGVIEGTKALWLFSIVSPYTLSGRPRIEKLFDLSRKIDGTVEGDIVECGTCNGGTGGLLAYMAENSSIQKRQVWFFDSFQGLPEPIDIDGKDAPKFTGECLGNKEKVKELLTKLSVPKNKVHIVEGWFDETFPKTSIDQISLLHIDADWYESVKLCLEHFYDKVEPKGFIVFDDYGYWPGCKAAVDEFIARRRLQVQLILVDKSGAYFQKPSLS